MQSVIESAWLCGAGARDGAVLLWDARVPSESDSRSCVLKVQVRS